MGLFDKIRGVTGTRLIFFFAGLMVFSYGISLAIQVKYLGIHPWDVLNLALFSKFGLSIGTWNIIVGLTLVAVALFLDRKYIHIGTFLNAVLVGVMVDFFNFASIFPPSSSTFTDVISLLFAILLMGIGGGMYSAARLGAGPRDGFMLSLSDRFGLSIRTVRIIIESLVLVIGLILGGPVFIFTFIYTFIQSPIFQYSFLLCTKWLNKRLPPPDQKSKTQSV